MIFFFLEFIDEHGIDIHNYNRYLQQVKRGYPTLRVPYASSAVDELPSIFQVLTSMTNRLRWQAGMHELGAKRGKSNGYFDDGILNKTETLAATEDPSS